MAVFRKNARQYKDTNRIRRWVVRMPYPAHFQGETG